MPEVNLTKTLSGLVPADPETEKWYNKIKPGGSVHAEFKVYRKPIFHRKYFALLKVGFDNWQPGEINSKYGTPEKNFDRFRKDIAILCGYFDLVIRLDGSSRPQAQSISFANMDQEEFEKLYSSTIDVLLKNVYGSDLDEDGLNDIVEKYLQFS
ncbi:MAG: DUF1367 family protein [Planctomycetota bacterium]|jgi:hypothetical protein